MGEVDKLLQDCEKRLKEISDLILNNASDGGNERLLDAAKELDKVQDKTSKEQAALEKCSFEISQLIDRSNFDVKQAFNEELEKSCNEKKDKKKKKGYFERLKKHIDQQDEEVLVVEKEMTQAIDPWTRQPIVQPVQSASCRHIYDKKSINCIIKNRPHFKCPYVGCQNVVTKDQLIDMNED